MESPNSPPTPTPPRLPPQTPSPPGVNPAGETGDSAQALAGAGAGVAGAPMRRFPKPPALLPRFLALCFRPESWAQTAQYPTVFTLVPLVLAILLGAAMGSTSAVWRLTDSLRHFADQYQAAGYPPLELTSDGTLQIKGALSEPIRFELPGPPGEEGSTVLIDPAGKTTPEAIKESGFLVNKDQVMVVSEGAQVTTLPLKRALLLSGIDLPESGQIKSMDAQAIRDYVSSRSGTFAVGGVFAAGILAVVEALWAAVMVFFVSPLIMLAAAGARLNSDAPERRLILPRRAAYRMAAGLLVPLVLLDAVLNALGHPVAGLLGGQGAIIFWFLAAGALAVWTGIMANHMYAPKPRRRA